MCRLAIASDISMCGSTPEAPVHALLVLFCRHTPDVFYCMAVETTTRKQESDPPPKQRNLTCVLNFSCSISDGDRQYKKSIFTPRRKEAESRTFWDTERVVRKALDTDFGRMLKEDRMVKLMAKSDSAVIQGKKTVTESLEEVRGYCSVGWGTDE